MTNIEFFNKFFSLVLVFNAKLDQILKILG